MLHRDRIALIAALALFTVVALAACRGSESGSAGAAFSHDLRFDRPCVLRARPPRVRTTVRRDGERRLRHRGDEIHWTRQSPARGAGSTTGRCLLVERTRAYLGAQVAQALAPYRSPNAEGIPTALVDTDGYWTGFSARIRVIAYNTTLVTPADAPKSVFDLADPRWRGQVAIADPRFGSTSFHVAALYAAAGDERMDAFFRRLKANDVKVVDGNSVVRDLVARGEVKIGLTDTDDVNVAIEDRQPIAMVLPDAAGLGVPVMPNMVSLIANAPHVEEGQRLIDYLLSRDVEEQLANSAAVQIPLHAGVPGPKNIPAIETFTPMTLDFTKAAQRVEDVTNRLAGILGL